MEQPINGDPYAHPELCAIYDAIQRALKADLPISYVRKIANDAISDARKYDRQRP